MEERSFNEEYKINVQLSDGRNINLFEAARDIFWLPVEPEFQRNREDNGEIVYRSPPDCATEFLVQFKAAVARMPKLHTFASEQMAPHRILSLDDGLPFEVGVLMKPTSYPLEDDPAVQWSDPVVQWSDFLYIFLETIAEEKGRINKLHCANELSGSLISIDPRYHAAMPYLISLELSIANFFPAIVNERIVLENMEILKSVICKATELRELSVSVNRDSEALREVHPLYRVPSRYKWFRQLFAFGHDPSGRPYKVLTWKHLRSLKLGVIVTDIRHQTLRPLIKAHVMTLRHLHLEHCWLPSSFARDLSQLDGLQLDSITISNADIISNEEIPEPGLVLEEELLRFIHCEYVGNDQAKEIEEGGFVTHYRRIDNIDGEETEDSEANPDEVSDHSSEWWSDTESDSEVGTDLDYEPRYFTSAAGDVLAELSF